MHINYSSEKYEPVIGLEVHAQMLTKSKAFCSCSTEFGAAPNSNTCPTCLGHPGTLPVLNENLLRFIVRMGLATNCKIRERSIFARKNYFYPDLPKGYQISQYETPICHDGFLDVELPSPNPSREREGNNIKRIGITRIHMEEDAGKSIHDFGAETLVDLNRAGVPLIEIVSEPDIRSSDEAYAYLTTIKSIVTYLGICDGNMEEGSLRCDANVSVRLRGAEKFGQKTEVKNMNSFRNVQRALESEIERQIGLVERGEPVIHQTMLFDANKGVTRAMRSKEEAHDYRYFPEPDLLPVSLTDYYIGTERGWVESIEMPWVKRDRFQKDYRLTKYEASVLTADKDVAGLFEVVAALNKKLLSFDHIAPSVQYVKKHLSKHPELVEKIGELLDIDSATVLTSDSVSAKMDKHQKELNKIVENDFKEVLAEITQESERVISADAKLIHKEDAKLIINSIKGLDAIVQAGAITYLIEAKSNLSLEQPDEQSLYYSRINPALYSSYKTISNFLLGDVRKVAADYNIPLNSSSISAESLGSLSAMTSSQTISSKIAKEIIPEIIRVKSSSTAEVISRRGLIQISDKTILLETVRQVIAINSKQLAQYKAGKTNLFDFFVGQTMKATQGKANPEMVNELMKEELERA